MAGGRRRRDSEETRRLNAGAGANSMHAAARSKRRWLQFSLRGLLVAITLGGIWLGRHVERVKHQKQAVAVWRGLGAEIGFRHELTRSKLGVLYFDSQLSPPAPAAVRRLLGDEHFETPIRVRLVTSKKVASQDFAALAGLPELETLEVYGRFQLTDTTLAQLGRLRRLERLVLANIDGASDASRISAAALDDLSRLGSLQELYLFDDVFSEADVESLRAALPDCKIGR